MTNNRKPVDEVRLSLSAARRREAGTHLYERLADKDMRDKPYTPPPNVAAWLKAQADKPKPHGRDIESLMRYHEAHKKPVGYWEDAPRGMKFAQDSTCPKCGNMMVAGHYCSTGGATAPTAIPPADGPWPKCLFGMKDGKIWACAVYTSNDVAVFWWNNKGITTPGGAPLHYGYDFNSRRADMTTASTETAIAWLEQNGHADVAAQLRGKGAADGLFEPVGTMPVVGDSVSYCGMVCCVSDVGGVCIRIRRGDSTYALHRDYDFMGGTARILKRPTKPRDDVATGARVFKNIFSYVVIGDRVYSNSGSRNAWVYDVNRAFDVLAYPQLELHGPERDAIVAECRKAMGLDTSSAGKDT